MAVVLPVLWGCQIVARELTLVSPRCLNPVKLGWAPVGSARGVRDLAGVHLVLLSSGDG